MDVRGSKCFKKLVPLILTHVCLRQGELLTYDSLSPQTALFVWTAPKVPFSLLFVKIDGSPHCKSCWHLTPASWNCVNMTSRTFVALHYNYVHVQFFEGWPFLKHPNALVLRILYFSMCWHLHKTRFQLILPVDSQYVTKNWMDYRIQVEGPQICQNTRWNNSFQNMYGMNRQQLTVRPGKSTLCKKTPYFRLFWWTRIWVTWLWKDLNAKPLTSGQLLGCPWKLWGITLQTSYVEGRLHQSWAHTAPLHFF